MSTLDDKLLGEKLHYYCSSDSSDGENDDEPNLTDDRKDSQNAGVNERVGPAAPYCASDDGTSTNTGPKGVLKDWRRYKQLEAEKREADEAEKLQLIKKISLTCRSELDEQKAQNEDEELDKELAELLEDDYLKNYMKQRMDEMYSRLETLPAFGQVISLKNGQEFLEAIDSEKKEVTIIIHLYSDKSDSCKAMAGCLSCLAKDYVYVKFCSLNASSAGVSNHFKSSGVPALLVYKGGQLMGNFVRLEDEFGDDFFAADVESFLIEHGMLPDNSLVSSIIRERTATHNEDQDSD